MDVLVRKMLFDDIGETYKIICRFFDEGWDKSHVTFNPKNIFCILYEAVLKGNFEFYIALVNGKIVGLLGALYTPSHFDENQFSGNEIVWFVDEPFRGTAVGGKLMERFEEECKLRNVDFITMTAGHYTIKTGTDKVLDRFYRRKGYEKLEIHYIKKLNRR